MLSTLVVTALALGVWVSFWSPLLHIDRIKVTGARETSQDDVEDAAALEPGTNLLLVSTGELADRIGRLPWARKVEVDRKLPGTLSIDIEERAPALVLSVGAATWTIDNKGHVLAPGDVKGGLPVLGGLEVGAIEPGERVDTDEALAALSVWRSLPRFLEADVAGVFAPTLERITFSLNDGTLVRYGAAEQLDAKNEVLRALLARIAADGRPVAYIDVRVPTNAAIAPLPDSSADPSPSPSA